MDERELRALLLKAVRAGADLALSALGPGDANYADPSDGEIQAAVDQILGQLAEKDRS